MSNNCFNEVEVVGKEAMVKAFLAESKGSLGKFNLGGVAPIPAGENDYSAIWGSGGISDVEVQESLTDDGQGSLYISFASPWGPPDKWFLKASDKYPELHMKMTYMESSCSVAGLMDYDPTRTGEKLREVNSGLSTKKYYEILHQEFEYEFACQGCEEKLTFEQVMVDEWEMCETCKEL